MKRFLIVLVTICALMTPAQIFGQDGYRRSYRDREGRYYDREHRDYHEWNERERRAWHRYWAEQQRRRREIAWERANERQRRAYWRWRHEHMGY